MRALFTALIVLIVTPASALAASGPGCLPTAPSTPVATAAAAKKGPSVKAVIRAAADAGVITPEVAQGYETSYTDAIAARKRLYGSQKTELSSVITTLETIARKKLLSVSRMPVLFRQLDVNTNWWSRSGPPAATARAAAAGGGPCATAASASNRVTFDDVVYQWYPGQGLQIQQLATAGRANGYAKACTEPDAGKSRCRPNKLRQSLDALVGLMVDRGGFRAWEYYFAFGRGTPPWISGMATATAMQALARGAQYLQAPAYLDAAKTALGAFQVKAPTGVRVATSRGNHYLLYSFDPSLRVYNGFLQALVGLYDYAEAAQDQQARDLFAAGEAEAYAVLPSADTGAWSLYSQGGRESDLGYHRLVRDFLEAMCARTERDLYCSMAERFTEYMHERTRVRFLALPKLRAGKPAKIRFSLSKVSSVNLVVRRNGSVVAVLPTLLLGRGTQQYTWTPSRRGTYELQLEAKDYISHYTRVTTTADVGR